MADSTTAVSVAAIDPNPTLNPPDPSPTPVTLFPNPNPVAIPPPSQSILTPIQASFIPGTQQFSTVTYQTPPPGVIMPSALPAPPQIPMMAPPYAITGQPVRYAAPPMPNGYPALPPPGVRYSSPYGPMLRPGFPPRPMIGIMPPLARPPIFGIRGPILPPTIRPAAIPIITPADKPQTTVYIGKISTTVDNEFMHSLLELCGPVKNWKRPQDPTGTLKGFGFCEFESAEGVLRALRLLSKLSIDGQELMVNVNQATREYLERFVEKKGESLKRSEEVEKDTQNEEPTTGGTDRTDTVKSSPEPHKLHLDDQKKDIGENSKKEDLDAANFGLVNNEDRDEDQEALGKLRQMLEERRKSRPLPPPPPPPQVPVDASGNSNSEHHSESKDIESDDIAKNDSEDKIEDDKTAESRLSNGNNRTEPASPDRSRRHERPLRHRDDEHKRERDREIELEKDEKERLQKIAKKDKDREYKSREDERRYKNREKEWEGREREREHWRKREREREKDRAQERRWEVIDQENDNDDSYSKKRKHKVSDEDRKRRQREKEDDISDRLKEEEEIAEAKMKAEEEQRKKLKEALNVISGQPANGLENVAFSNETNLMELDDQNVDNKPSRGLVEGDVVDGVSNEPITNAPTMKFGLSGIGKRAAVPSLFMADEDEDTHKDKKMRPLVPIDYSTEEQQPTEFPSSNVVAATEFVKHISTTNVKEEKPDLEKERSRRRSRERSSQRDRGRHEEETTYSSRDRDRSSKKSEIPKILDAKQLIDTIPKTRDELFTYEINWAIYDQNSLHDRMRPWISKKITEFLGEEEVTLVDYIVSSTQEHVDASEMLERLQTILDDEAEMFVLKMWRMLIFEIKKVETGLTPKSRS